MARSDRQVSIVNLLLSGVIVSTFCGALILLFFTLQSENAFSLFFFFMGSLIEGNPELIWISAGIILSGCAGSYFLARNLNLLSLGEEKARHLGLEVESFKLLTFALASLVVSAAVAVSGTIGFVGLLVPHMARLLVGPDHKILLPASALGGSILLVLADDIARTAASPIEIPVGIIMSLIGAPFFLWLLRRKGKSSYF